MTRALAHRLTRLEQQARTRALSMAWPEVHAAAQRLRSYAVATHVQGVMAAHGEFLCNNSSIKDIESMRSCRLDDRCLHE